MNTEDFEKKGEASEKKEPRPSLPKQNEIQNILDQLRQAFDTEAVMASVAPDEEREHVPSHSDFHEEAEVIEEAEVTEEAEEAEALEAVEDSEATGEAEEAEEPLLSATPVEDRAIPLTPVSLSDRSERTTEPFLSNESMEPKEDEGSSCVPADAEPTEPPVFGGVLRSTVHEELSTLPPVAPELSIKTTLPPPPRESREKEELSPLQERLRALRRLHEEYMYTGETVEEAAAEEPKTEESTPSAEPIPEETAVTPEPAAETAPKTEFSEAAQNTPTILSEPEIREIPEPTLESVRQLLETTFFTEEELSGEGEDPSGITLERDTITDDFDIPEEILEEEPFDADDYVISDSIGGERLSSGKNLREYVSHNQNAEITRVFEKRLHTNLLRIIFIAVLSTLLFISENSYLIGWQIPIFNTDLGIRGLSILVNMQTLFLVLLLSVPYLYRGILAIRNGSFTVEAAALVFSFAVTVYDLVLYIADMHAPRMLAFCPALFYLLLAIFDWVEVNSDFLAFKVVSTTARKTVVVTAPLSRFPSESAAAKDLELLPDAPYSKARRAGFVEGFFTRSSVREGDKMGGAILLVSLLSAILVFVFSFFLLQKDLNESFSLLILGFLAFMPAASFFLRPLAFSRLSRKAVMQDSAVVGEYSALEYASTRVIAMEDTDLFPSKNVKVKGIKLFGENRLDRVLCQVAVLFQKTGGPLSGVFGHVGKSGYSPEDVELRSASENGLSARILGDNLLVGTAEYMEENGVTLYYDSEDTRQTDTGKISILYVAENGIVSARFYLQYIPNPEFEKLCRRLSEVGVSVLIHSFDPSITDRLLEKVSYISELSVRVVRKSCDVEEERRPRLNSGIVTTGRQEHLIDLFFDTIRLRRLLSHDFRFVILGVTALSLFTLLFLGKTALISSALLGLYQLFWLLPLWLLTKIFLKDK